MKTLLERLKPEIKEIFDAEAVKYPLTVKFIMGHFAQETWVGNLRLGTLIDIAVVNGLKEHLGVKYDEMFLLTTLNQMFNAE